MNSDDKSAIRQQVRALRRGLDPEEAARRGLAVTELALRIPELRDATTVLSYVASKENEVETVGLIGRLLAEDRDVGVPRAGSAGELLWVRIHNTDGFVRGRYGILEPPSGAGPTFTPPDWAVVLVPGIAFSPSGQRIGFGGGYFDRFLATHAGLSIGLAYDFQVVPDWTPEPHDVAVQMVLTESTVYRRR